MDEGGVVVTGAAGFLGSHLIRRARASRVATLAVVRRAAPGGEAAAAGVATIDAVLARPALLDGARALVHAAAIRHRHGADAAGYRASNVDLVERLVRAAAGRVARFVFVSSVGVYGFPARLPVDESAPYAPATLYSATKVDAEKLVMRLCPQLSLPYTIIRPTIIYGRGDRNGMLDKLATMIRARRYLLVGPGTNTLHHTHVDDVARGIETLAEADAGRDAHFIVAGPETITLARLGELVSDAVGVPLLPGRVPLPLARAVASAVDIAAWRGLAFRTTEPPINHEKLDVMTRSIAFDASKARAAGFEPRIGYAEGIRMTLGGSG